MSGGKNRRKSLKFWVPKEEKGVILRVMRTYVWYSTGGDLGQAKELALHSVAIAAHHGQYGFCVEKDKSHRGQTAEEGREVGTPGR